jgi:excinuclease UvrABC nuclease subunit
MKPSASQGVMPQPGTGVDGQTSVYRIRDAEGSLLYVGMATNPMNRWAAHAAQHPWWARAASWEVEWFDTRAEAADAEKRAIKTEDPECNIYHRPGWGQYAYGKYMETLKRNQAMQANSRYVP